MPTKRGVRRFAVRIDADVHAELVRRRAELELVEGRRRTMSELIRGLLGQQEVLPRENPHLTRVSVESVGATIGQVFRPDPKKKKAP